MKILFNGEGVLFSDISVHTDWCVKPIRRMKHCTVLKWNMWHFQWEGTCLCKEKLVNSECYILNVLVICLRLSFHTFMYSPGTCVGRQLAYSLAYDRKGVITWMDGLNIYAMSSLLLRTWVSVLTSVHHQCLLWHALPHTSCCFMSLTRGNFVPYRTSILWRTMFLFGKWHAI